MSVPMALVDFLPVIFFGISAVILQRGLYDKMSKGAFALLAAGTIMSFMAGFMKAIWKLLYAADVCDFERLNQCFFPMQSVGLLLAGLSVAALLLFKQKKTENETVLEVSGLPLLLPAAAPAVYSGTMIFVAMLVLGALGYCGGLGIYAARQGKKKTAILFWIAFASLVVMGYLSSRDFTKAYMNWIAEGVNIAGQLVLLIAAVCLVKKQKG